jgi:hypothetical protein
MVYPLPEVYNVSSRPGSGNGEDIEIGVSGRSGFHPQLASRESGYAIWLYLLIT